MNTGKPSLLYIIAGMLLVFVGVACILLVYGYFFGVSGGGDVVITPPGISLIFALMFIILVLGLVGGLLMGRSLWKKT